MSYSLLNDREIRALCQGDEPMLFPFYERSVGVAISHGVSSFGYDLMVADEYDIFDPALVPPGTIVDPVNFDKTLLRHHKGPYVDLPVGGFALARSVETFWMPQDLLTICLGKSSYARVGLVVNVTPFEPGWKGVPTMELSNTCGMPLRVHSFMGIAQVLFFRGNRPDVTYSDRKGKYQDQSGITPIITG